MLAAKTHVLAAVPGISAPFRFCKMPTVARFVKFKCFNSLAKKKKKKSKKMKQKLWCP